MDEQAAAVGHLAQFLTKPGYSSGGKTPLQEEIERQIKKMASEIAAEVIRQTPQLEDRVRQLTAKAVQDALSGDKFLSDLVTDAVARVLVTRMRHVSDDDD
jgi:hypothetical protein